VDDAIAWAKEQPEPEPADAHEDVFANPPDEGSGEASQATAATDGGDE
jgi:pyruvate dehydrogenase E1 component alpha subunit